MFLIFQSFFSCIHTALFPPGKESTDAAPDEGRPYHVHEEETRCIRPKYQEQPQKNLHHRYRHIKSGISQRCLFSGTQDHHENTAEKNIEGKEERQHEGHHGKSQGNHHPQAEGRIKDCHEKMPERTTGALRFHPAENLAYPAKDKDKADIISHRQKRLRRLRNTENTGAYKKNTANKKQC